MRKRRKTKDERRKTKDERRKTKDARHKTGILGLNAAFFLISPGFQPFSNFVAVATSPVS
jgi:hypothetical protein